DSLADRGSARTLRTGAGSNHPVASVLAHRRRRAQGDRRRLHRARALESGGEGWSRCGLLFRLAEYAGTVNVVRLTPAGEVAVARVALDIAREPSAVD